MDNYSDTLPPDDVQVTLETEPAYNLNGWQSTEKSGPQCSAAGEVGALLLPIEMLVYN